jgi:hypothetical protein
MVTRIETRSLRFLLLEGVEQVGGISIASIMSAMSAASVMVAISLDDLFALRIRRFLLANAQPSYAQPPDSINSPDIDSDLLHLVLHLQPKPDAAIAAF